MHPTASAPAPADPDPRPALCPYCFSTVPACARCGAPMTDRHPAARYCSTACRVAAYRERRRARETTDG